MELNYFGTLKMTFLMLLNLKKTFEPKSVVFLSSIAGQVNFY